MQREFETLLSHGYVAGSMDTKEKISAGFKQFGQMSGGNPEFTHTPSLTPEESGPKKSFLEIDALGAMVEFAGDASPSGTVEQGAGQNDHSGRKENKTGIKKMRFVFERKMGVEETAGRTLRRNTDHGGKAIEG